MGKHPTKQLWPKVGWMSPQSIWLSLRHHQQEPEEREGDLTVPRELGQETFKIQNVVYNLPPGQYKTAIISSKIFKSPWIGATSNVSFTHISLMHASPFSIPAQFIYLPHYFLLPRCSYSGSWVCGMLRIITQCTWDFVDVVRGWGSFRTSFTD